MKNWTNLTMITVTSVVCFMYFTALIYMSTTNFHSEILQAIVEMVTIPSILISVAIVIFSLVLLIRSKFTERGYLVPLAVSSITLGMLFFAK